MVFLCSLVGPFCSKQSREFDRALLDALGEMLREVNPFVQRIAEAATKDAPNLVMRICASPRLDRRRYNLPSAPEVAAFIPDEEVSTAAQPRDVIVRLRVPEGEPPRLVFINEFSAVYDPLHFVLLFPRGELGWSPDIGTRDAAATQRAITDLQAASVAQAGAVSRQKVTLKDYFSYYLMERVQAPWCSYLHLCGALFQEWKVFRPVLCSVHYVLCLCGFGQCFHAVICMR